MAYKGINLHIEPIFKVGLILDRNCITLMQLSAIIYQNTFSAFGHNMWGGACDSNTKCIKIMYSSKICVNSLTSALTIHIAQVSKFQQHYIPADGNIQTVNQIKKYRRRGLNHAPNYCNTFSVTLWNEVAGRVGRRAIELTGGWLQPRSHSSVTAFSGVTLRSACSLFSCGIRV
jgi:hypothetical protein